MRIFQTFILTLLCLSTFAQVPTSEIDPKWGPLVATLDSIYNDDQLLRLKLDTLEKQYGQQSDEVKQVWEEVDKLDAKNIVKVKRIIDEYGWLGPDKIGERGNSTLFLVIQHSDFETQKKYLPIMQEAAKRGDVYPADLAYLEDRIAVNKNLPQPYGSQLGFNEEINAFFLFPLEDPDSIDERRASVGLGPIAEYLLIWDLNWDLKQYKKDVKITKKYLKNRTKGKK